MEVIDWKKALIECDNDSEFLAEILEDLLQEAHDAKLIIEKAINNINFKEIENQSRQVEGIGYYLSCSNLRSTSEELQYTCRAARDLNKTSVEATDTMNVVKVLFNDYCDAIEQLEMEIRANGPVENFSYELK